MTYVKPEFAVLGDALTLIEQIANKQSNVKDGVNSPPGPGPAYDLDE